LKLHGALPAQFVKAAGHFGAQPTRCGARGWICWLHGNLGVMFGQGFCDCEAFANH